MKTERLLDDIKSSIEFNSEGALTSQEVVDFALGLLAYEDRYELAEPALLLLMPRYSPEILRWMEYVEGKGATHHWMPYRDSRLVAEYYGGVAGSLYTEE